MNNLFLFLLLLVTVSCSDKRPKTKTSIEVSLGALNSANFPGGVLLHAKEVDTGELLTFKLTDSDTVEIPFGKWTFYVVGLSTPVLATKCGGGTQYVLDSSEVSFSISATSGACSGAIYTDMIASVGATFAAGSALWDTAVWDAATWAP